jgi:hypothetical protein
MRWSRLRPWLGTICVLSVASMIPAMAQTSAPDEAMRTIAARSVGMPESSFEVSSSGTVITVLRVNSTMNASSHQGRNNEAAEIAKALTDAFGRKAAHYEGIQSISVDYVERVGTQTKDILIDRIDFRKTAAGQFELHIT